MRNCDLKECCAPCDFTILDMTGTSPDLAGNNTDSRTSKPTQACRSPDFWYLLVSSVSFATSSPLSLSTPQHGHHRQTQCFVIPLYLWMQWSWVNTNYSIHWVQYTLSTAYTKHRIHRVQHSPSTVYFQYNIHQVQHTPSTEYTEYSLHQVHCTPSTVCTKYSIYRVQHTASTPYTEYSIHRVQHTLSTAYTEYSIHRVQHTPSTAYTEYSIHWVQHPWKIFCLPFIHMFTNWHLNVAPASGMPPYKIDRYQPALHDCSTSAKTKSPSLNLFSLLYPQTQKNEIEDSLKYGIALVFHSVHWVVAMLFSSLTTSVPTVANVTVSTWRTVNTAFGDVTYHFAPYSYVAQFDQSSQSWK